MTHPPEQTTEAYLDRLKRLFESGNEPIELMLDMAWRHGYDQKKQELEATITALKESISPGRIGPLEYYCGVAARMRARELQLKAIGMPGDCKRELGHSGPCNGYPRETCPKEAAK